MNFVLTIDDAYCQHAAVVIASVCSYNSDCKFFIISDYLTDENVSKLTCLCDEFAAGVDYIQIEKSFFSKFPIGKGTISNHISSAAYYRLFIPNLLPVDIAKIIYLDCDIVVTGSLERLWNFPLERGTYIAALEELNDMAKNGTKRLNYPFMFSYFNSGVLLLDVNGLRNYDFSSKAVTYLQENKDRILFHDQDVLNALLYDKKVFMPLKYNVIDTFLRKGAHLPKRYMESQSDLFHPVIVHFTGPVKPWFTECNHPYKGLYFHYLSFTPWKSYKPIPRYTTMWDKCVYHVKRLGKIILEVLNIRKYSFRKDLPDYHSLYHNK